MYFRPLLLLAYVSLIGCAVSEEQDASITPGCEASTNIQMCEELLASRFYGISLDRDKERDSHDSFVISFDKSEAARFVLPDCQPNEDDRDFAECNIVLSEEHSFDFALAGSHPSDSYRSRLTKTLTGQSENIFVSSISTNTNEFNFSIVHDPCFGTLASEPSQSNPLHGCTLVALEHLEVALAQQMQSADYTHIIVYSTGWNTAPEKSVDRYAESLDAMELASSDAGREFKPLLIGITWPSNWRLPVLSYQNKANDADEIGQVWGAYLLNETIPAAMANAGVDGARRPIFVAIGHSFGARALATAISSAKFTSWPGKSVEVSLDHLILLQPAFSAARLYSDPTRPGGSHFRYYPNIEELAGSVIATSSGNDGAVVLAFWANEFNGHLGSSFSWEAICGKGEGDGFVTSREAQYWNDRFFCVSDDQDDLIDAVLSPAAEGRIKLLRLDGLISDHSDVFYDSVASVILPTITQ